MKYKLEITKKAKGDFFELEKNEPVNIYVFDMQGKLVSNVLNHPNMQNAAAPYNRAVF